jgi:hypothetical protein
VLGSSALLGLALAVPRYAQWLAVAAAAWSTAGVCWEFYRGRDYYLDARIRNKAIREASAVPGRS